MIRARMRKKRRAAVVIVETWSAWLRKKHALAKVRALKEKGARCRE